MTPRPAADDVSPAARFFLALADPTRLALLDELRAGEKTVGELVSALGCPQPKVSRHLKVLREAGLVHDRRDGRNVSYALSPRAGWSQEARDWLKRLDAGASSGPRTARPRRPPRAEPAAPAPASDPPPAVTPPPELEDYLL